MGFFNKVWKGIKTAVKSTFKRVKKAFKSVGKLFGKMGIVGQIALGFLLPGIGSLIGHAGKILSAVPGLGQIVSTVGKFASTVGNVYKTVSDGIFGFVEKVGKGMMNKAGSLLGREELLFKNAPATIQEGFKQWTEGVVNDAKGILDPFKPKDVSNAISSSFEKQFEIDPDRITPVETAEMGTGRINMEAVGDSFSTPSLGEGFENKFNIPENLYQAEVKENTNFLSKIDAFARKTATGAVENFTDTLTSQTASGIAQQITGTVPKTEVTNISNVVPQFNSTPITSLYEQNGFSYGATPDNRLQFYASNQVPQTDFGRGAFSAFSQLNGVAA